MRRCEARHQRGVRTRPGKPWLPICTAAPARARRAHQDLGQEGEGPHGRGGVRRRLCEEEEALRLLQRRDRRCPENLVGRNFRAGGPNGLWLADVTQFSIPAGKIYLSPAVDCFDGMPVSWAIRKSPNAEMANTMLRSACETIGGGEAPVIHSDRGCHCRWPGWLKTCEDDGLVRSMSKKGCSPDNSAMEGFFGRLKNEFFYDRDWDGVSIDEFISLLDDYMRYYRDDRIKESLDWKSPMQYRKSLGMVA
ncbi:IS3 family transposase [Eggerthellaceae bacterium zg-887]|uniref:IS3 family transposase n=1 Tax=Xiamenia xianingshaonis TaxID=2682776 RepID=UPI0014089939|nr:IS3 family transposase [Xiamenia xianingshaonis]NHM15813.1 IS3 family transposase [Xiamenia xianingshaonis]